MLDRWSVMVFERAIITSNPKLSISYTIDPILSAYENTIDLHVQSIIEAEDLQIIITSTKIICETVNNLLGRLGDNCREDVQLNIKCDILRQKLDMLLDTLIEETNGVHDDDDLIRSLNAIIKKSFNERYGTADFKTLPPNIGKTEKDKLNSKERFNNRLARRGDKEALQCRSNSFKRAVHNIVQHPERDKPMKPSRRMSLRMDSLRVQQQQLQQLQQSQQAQVSSSDTSPCTSPFPVPNINLISPSLSTTRLTCISPLPDLRRDSMDETFLSSLNLPVPRQFADNGSRRSSGVPESIKEIEESASTPQEKDTLSPSQLQPQTFFFDRERFPSLTKSQHETIEKHLEYLGISQGISCDETGINDNSGMIGLIPIEVYERNLIRSTKLSQEKKQQDTETESDETAVTSNNLPVPINTESEQDTKSSSKTQNSQEKIDNVYIGESMTIIDTDQPERSSSDDIPGEASDILSAISNEECSVTSDILDKPLVETFKPAAEIIQDLDADQIGHIDSPETSDTTDALHGESLIDDISSVLGHDLLGALQDNTITDDTTTLCTEKPRKRSIKNKRPPPPQQQLSSDNEDITQFGFENMVFEMDNRCDDQKTIETIRYCSLAHFVEGSDIARKSFKRPNLAKRTSLKRTPSQKQQVQEKNNSIDKENDGNVKLTNDYLDSIKIEIQGSHSDLTDNETEVTIATATTVKALHTATTQSSDVKHITFQHDVKFDDEDSDGDESKQPKFNVVVEPPSPIISDELRVHRINEIRRHSSHAPSLSTKEYEKEKDRRHSGYNPNLLGLDSEHMRFLNCSPAASRRISSGSLFKVI